MKEIELFRKIWRERPHRSEISGERLLYFHPIYFSHVLSKGSRPDLKFCELNIVLKTAEEHQLWENHKSKIAGDPNWDWIFKLRDYLKSK